MSEVRYQAGEGQIGRIIPARLQPGTDLIEGIEKICKDFNIKTAVVCCSIGSFQKVKFQYLIPKPELKLKSGYGEPVELQGPIEVSAGMGLVTQDEKGNITTHFHAVFHDKLDHTYGGHLVRGGNPILATIDLTIIEIKGLNIIRSYDEETEVTTSLKFSKA
jgi:predicted DNA-binding protein with PD1-like motif